MLRKDKVPSMKKTNWTVNKLRKARNETGTKAGTNLGTDPLKGRLKSSKLTDKERDRGVQGREGGVM